jgi:hypothetical protein
MTAQRAAGARDDLATIAQSRVHPLGVGAKIHTLDFYTKFAQSNIIECDLSHTRFCLNGLSSNPSLIFIEGE